MCKLAYVCYNWKGTVYMFLAQIYTRTHNVYTDFSVECLSRTFPRIYRCLIRVSQKNKKKIKMCNTQCITYVHSLYGLFVRGHCTRCSGLHKITDRNIHCTLMPPPLFYTPKNNFYLKGHYLLHACNLISFYVKRRVKPHADTQDVTTTRNRYNLYGCKH